MNINTDTNTNRDTNALSIIENTLVAHLKKCFPNLDVAAFPSLPSLFTYDTNTGQILVRYDGARYEAPYILESSAQTRMTTWIISIFTRSLRDHQDSNIYAIIEGIRRNMQGWTTPQSTAATFIVTEGFVPVEGPGIWRYDVKVSIPTLAIGNE